MKKERIKILEMLENGKINADEATKLLDALKNSAGHDWEDYYTEWDADEKLERFTKNVDSFARDFGSKVESAYKDVEPKLKKATKTVVEKTASIFDDISKSLNESLKKMDNDNCCCEHNDCDDNQDCCDDDHPREN